MEKTLVFLSHITEEKEIAIAFKSLIESSFLGMIDVFVSSDDNTIQMGQKWLDKISNGLKTCKVEIVLCSPQSVKRPWINFEAGAGWVRDITVIPLCHSGITPSELPMPLNLLQAGSANEISSLKLIFPVLAQAIGAQNPSVDFSDFVKKVIDFEERYTFWDACNKAFSHFLPEVLNHLKKGETVEMMLTETEVNAISQSMSFLKIHRVIDFINDGSTSMGSGGVRTGWSIKPLDKFNTTVKNPNFRSR